MANNSKHMMPLKPIFAHVNIAGVDKINVRFDVSTIMSLLLLPKFVMIVFEPYKFGIYLAAFIIVLFDARAFSQTCVLFRKTAKEIYVGVDGFSRKRMRNTSSIIPLADSAYANRNFLNVDTKEGMRYLMQRQIDVAPNDTVGEPINIIHILKDSIDWKPVKPCPR
jgi:hypothetical protein